MSQSMSAPFESVLAAPLTPLRNGGLGFVGADVPLELLLASGRPFGHLPWQADQPTPKADRWLESSFPGWARSILEQWFAGAFDGVADVVFSRADDATQRLCYYIRELQSRGLLRGPAPHLLDLALIPRATSLAHSAAAIETLAARLGIDASAWPPAMARADRLRSQLAGINARRGGEGALHERLFRAALWSDATQWIDAVSMPLQDSGPRILLAGSMPPDDRLHRAVDRAGACIIDEVHPGGPLRLGPVPGQSGESPALRIARHLQLHGTGPRAFIDRATQVLARARERRAAGVILWMTREDEGLAWQVPAQSRALREAGIPLLALTDARWSADDGALGAVTRFCTEGLA
jgi:hypothetical protein